MPGNFGKVSRMSVDRVVLVSTDLLQGQALLDVLFCCIARGVPPLIPRFAIRRASRVESAERGMRWAPRQHTHSRAGA